MNIGQSVRRDWPLYILDHQGRSHREDWVTTKSELLLGQLSYAIKNQLKAPKATWGILFLFLSLYGKRESIIIDSFCEATLMLKGKKRT